MLAWFAWLLFALMGVSALALDMGVARLAQTRLETAAEFAALARARGVPEQDIRARLDELWAEGTERPGTRLRLGPIGPLDTSDPGCPGSLPGGTAEPTVLARRIPLLFGHGSMLAFASPTSWGDILEARTDPTVLDPADWNPTPVLPDSAIPPDVLALREQGLCVEGRGRARLVPALAVAGIDERTLPGTELDPLGPLGLSLLDTGELWGSRNDTLETTCTDTPQGGPWFELATDSAQPCQFGDEVCTVPVRSSAFRVESRLRATRADFVPAAEPTEADLHRRIVAPLRNAADSVVGFAALCARRVGTDLYVSPRWNDASTPFTAFTSALRDTDVRTVWRSVVAKDKRCRHPLDPDLRCFVQSAVLALPEAG